MRSFSNYSAPGPPPNFKELIRKPDDSKLGAEMRNPYVSESSTLHQQDHFMRSPTPSPSSHNTRDHNSSFFQSNRTIEKVDKTLTEESVNNPVAPSGIDWTRPQAPRDAPRSRHERERLAQQQAEQHHKQLLVEQWRARGFHEVDKLDDKARIKVVENHWKDSPELPDHSVGIEWSNSTPRGSPDLVDPPLKTIPIETRLPTVPPSPVVSRTPVTSPTPTVVDRFV
ncbi:hypothetical protein RUND412_005041 [Rhizina undulata]